MKELPKWFTKQGGKQYTDGASVSNPFTGSAITLNANELSIYDFIIGCQVSRPNNFLKSSEIQKQFRKSLDWFRKANPEAYMVLLD